MSWEYQSVSRRDTGLALLLEQTARQVYEKRGPQDVHPGQWAALRYFARANRNVRTVAGLANYLSVTKGPASRAAPALVRHGFLHSEKQATDRRTPVFTVTEAGRRMLDEDPIRRLAAAIADLDEHKRTAFTESLESLYAALNR